MTDDLRRDLDRAVGPVDGRPELADLWRSGRRRRARARAAAFGGVAAALVLLVAGTLVVTQSADDAERVSSAGPGPATCTPAPTRLAGRPPRTAESFVRGGGPGVVQKPTVVARVKVVRVWRVPVERSDLLTSPSPAPTYERRAEVEVVTAISGARVGERLVVSDAMSAAWLDDLATALRRVRRQIEDVQSQLDHDPGDVAAQALLRDYQERLQVLQVSERVGPDRVVRTPCHSFGVGDELIVAVTNAGLSKDIYELTNPSSFFLITDGQLSPELDAARRSVAGWPDTPLARLARRSSPDELIAALRAAR